MSHELRLSFRDVLHGFCVWCAASLLICLILYSIFELFIRFFHVWAIPGGGELDEELIFDDVISAVKEISRKQTAKFRRSKFDPEKSPLPFEVQFEIDPRQRQSIPGSSRDVEGGRGHAERLWTPTVKKIIVKPWNPD